MSEEGGRQESDMEDSDEQAVDRPDSPSTASVQAPTTQQPPVEPAPKSGRRTSVIWEHFLDCDEDPKKVVCVHCSAKVNRF